MSIIEKFLELEKKQQDKTAKEVMTETTKKDKKHFVRSLGNVYTTAEAQRIFNPQLPPTKPKPPTEAQTKLGTSSSMDVEGNWGQSGRQE
jgi:hypothetical protein